MASFYFPPEWAPHEATWLAWPHNRRDWPVKFAAIPLVFAEMVRWLATSETVRILVQGAAHEAAARRALADIRGPAAWPPERVEFFRIPTDRGWTRDMGPMFVRRGGPQGELVIADFRFTAWAKHPDFARDDRMAARVAKKLKLDAIRPAVRDERVVLEGGAIDVNGGGTLLATVQCLLDNTQQARNPSLTREEIEAVLAETLGATNVCFLDRGIAGDDTGGHIDDFCRFVDKRTIALMTCDNPQDENFPALRRAQEQLADLRLEDGSRPEVVSLPSPEPLYFRGQRLPASYANFYIANAVVLVPTFNDPADRRALGLLAELFPNRRVVGIHAVDLVWGFGAIHCLTQQQPIAGEALAKAQRN